MDATSDNGHYGAHGRRCREEGGIDRWAWPRGRIGEGDTGEELLSEQRTGCFSLRTSWVFVPHLREGQNASAERAGESASPRGYDATYCYRRKKQRPGTALSHIFVWSGYSSSTASKRGDC